MKRERKKSTAREPEIKTTRAMITAGVYVLQSHDPGASQDEEIVRGIFEAMVKASRKPRS